MPALFLAMPLKPTVPKEFFKLAATTSNNRRPQVCSLTTTDQESVGKQYKGVRMNRYFSKVLVMVGVVVFLGFAGTAAAQVNDGDQQFMKEAATGGMAEVDLGRLAARKGRNAQVRSFGNRMVRDHSKANVALKSLARRKHVKLPTTATDEQKTEKASLMKLSGAEFDREYMRMMVEDHDKDVAAFQQKSNDAGDAALKTFVTRTLPTLETHQKMAHDIQGKVQ